MKSSTNSSDQSMSDLDQGEIKQIEKKKIRKEKKDKKQKKEKKSKKDKDRDNQKKQSKSKKNGQDRSKEKEKKKKIKPKWGKYGIINQTDLHQRREEFMMWLSEVKCFNIETLSQQDERKLFEEYVECYNTATLPSKKYYNFKVWFDKGQMKGKVKNQEIEMSVFNDEEDKKKELMAQKQLLRDRRVNEQYQTLHEHEHLAAEMQEKQQMQELMRHQYLVGNHEAALKIHKLLEPKRPVIIAGDSESNEY